MALAVRYFAYVAGVALLIIGFVSAYLFVVGDPGERSTVAAMTDGFQPRSASDPEYSAAIGRVPIWVAPTPKYDLPAPDTQAQKKAAVKSRRPRDIIPWDESVRGSFAREDSYAQEPKYFSEPYRGQ